MRPIDPRTADPEAQAEVHDRFVRPVIVFDGVCGLCNGWVDFVLRHDRRGEFRFTPYQSEFGAQILRAFDLQAGESILVVEGERVWRESAAVLEICRRLGGIWSVAAVGRLVPAALRDRLYRFIAVRRYRWFGRRETCRLPTAEERGRFL